MFLNFVLCAFIIFMFYRSALLGKIRYEDTPVTRKTAWVSFVAGLVAAAWYGWQIYNPTIIRYYQDFDEILLQPLIDMQIRETETLTIMASFAVIWFPVLIAKAITKLPGTHRIAGAIASLLRPVYLAHWGFFSGFVSPLVIPVSLSAGLVFLMVLPGILFFAWLTSGRTRI